MRSGAGRCDDEAKIDAKRYGAGRSGAVRGGARRGRSGAMTRFEAGRGGALRSVTLATSCNEADCGAKRGEARRSEAWRSGG